MKRDLNLALVGAGFIGRSHALAIHAVNRVFPTCALRAQPFILAEANQGRAADAAAEFGFRHWTASWEEAVDRADAVVLATPSFMHRPVALRTLEQGKPLLCEKPVGLSAAEAQELAELAERRGAPVGVGFTYARLPLVRHAKSLIDGGTLGRVVPVRGRHAE